MMTVITDDYLVSTHKKGEIRVKLRAIDLKNNNDNALNG